MDPLKLINTDSVDKTGEDGVLSYPPELEFSKWNSPLVALLSEHKTYSDEITANRKARDIDFDVEAAQLSGH